MDRSRNLGGKIPMKRVAINGIILILSGLLASPAFALVSTFRSRVVDEKGVPVVGAKVVLSCSGEGNAQHETKTNKKGEFTQVIMNFKAKWKLVISMDGFLDYLEKDIQIPPGAEVDHPQISMRAGQSTGGKIEEQNAALRKLNA
ncbi:MAG: carboxypeptidase-like regulatory domain-containing protein, partial [Vicinamibacteria bacterium]|nr:carboxypeptidase-like regulatory domain-containing protein [Vicinamibacteria bacterium]